MFLPPEHNQNIAPVPQQEQPNFPSRKIHVIRAFTRLSTFGFWFSIGLAAANLARTIPDGWAFYWALALTCSFYLVFVKPTGATEDIVTSRQVSGVALATSVIAFWDAVLTVANLPIALGFLILPAWLGAVLAVLLVLLLGVFTLASAQRRR
jgi:hypothetical protein